MEIKIGGVLHHFNMVAKFKTHSHNSLTHIMPDPHVDVLIFWPNYSIAARDVIKLEFISQKKKLKKINKNQLTFFFLLFLSSFNIFFFATKPLL